MSDLAGINLGRVSLDILPEVQQNAFRAAAISAGTQFARQMGQQFGQQLNQQLARQATPAMTRLTNAARDAAGAIVHGMNQASIAVSRLSTQIALTAFGFQLIGQQINRFITIPLATATAGILKFGIEAAAGLEQSAILMKNVIGDTGNYKQIFSDLIQLAIKSPVFDTEKLTKYSAQLIGAGFETKKLLPFMQALGNLFLAQGLDANQASQSLLALTQMYSKGKITGQELNVQLRNAFPGSMKIFQQAAKNLGVASVEELIDAIDGGKITMSQFFDELTKIGNSPAMLKQAAEAAGGLKASWVQLKEELKTKFAMAFLDENFRLKPEFKESFDRFAALVKGLGDEFIKMIPRINEEFQKFLDKLEELKQKWDELDPKTKEMIKNLVLMAAAAGPLATALGIAGIMAGTLVRGLAFFLLNPVGLAISGITLAVVGLGLAFLAAYNDSEEFRKGVEAFVEAVRKGWEEHIKPALGELTRKIKEELIPALEDLLASLGFESWEEFGKWLGETLITAGEHFIRMLGTAVEWITAVVKHITFLVIHFKQLKQDWDLVVAAFQTGIDTVKSLWSQLSTNTTNLINDLKLKWEDFKRNLDNIWTQVESRVETVKTNITNTFSTLVQGIKTSWEGIQEIFKTPINAVITFYNTGIGGLWGAAKKVFTSLPDFSSAPHLASGGKVPRAPGITGDWVPIFATAGEYMLSRENVAQLGGYSGIQELLKTTGAQHYADGGPIGALAQLGAKAFGVASKLFPGGFLADAAIKALTSGLSKVADGFGDQLGGMPRAAAKTIFDSAIELLKGNDTLSSGGLFTGEAGGGLGTGAWPPGPWAQRGDSGVWRKIVAFIKSTGPLSGSFSNAYRPGDPLWHGSGRAVDWGGYNQDALAQVLYKMRPLELIHSTNRHNYGVSRGVPHNMGSQLWGEHRDHIHVAFDDGGWMQPGMTGVNKTRAPEPVFTNSQWQVLKANVEPSDDSGERILIVEGEPIRARIKKNDRANARKIRRGRGRRR